MRLNLHRTDLPTHLVAGMLLVLTAVAPAAEAGLTNDSFALTEAGACKDGVCTGPFYAGPGGVNTLSSFGDVTYGAADGGNSGNGFDSAESLNAQDHFGLHARGSANSTEQPGAGSGWAWGSFGISVLIPPQQGHAAGTPGTLVLPYHLHGTVTIDWGEVFVDGMLVSGATARLLWDISTFNIGGSGFDVHHMANDSWSGNDVSVTVDRDLTATISFAFGTIFYIDASYYVLVSGYSLAPPAVGFVEADFLHTATLGTAIVQDGSGNVVANPIIVSDTGFDFANPSGAGASLDHFLCYKTTSTKGDLCSSASPADVGAACTAEEDCGGTTDATAFCVPGKFPKGTHVALADQFESKNFDVIKPLDLCTPADTGQGVDDAATHLQAFQIKESKKTCAAGALSNTGGVCTTEADCGGTKKVTTFCQNTPKHAPQTHVQVDNELGTLVVDTVKPDRLLVPTAKGLTGPVAAPDDAGTSVDRFKCYTVKVSPGTPKFATIAGVALQDQFITGTPKLFDLKKPTRLCTPVQEDAHQIKNADAHLMCYQAVPSKHQPKHVAVTSIFVDNEFGPERIDTIKEDELCVPSTKTVGGPSARTRRTRSSPVGSLRAR